MPEQAEVQIITNQLAQHLIGKTISAINIYSGRYLKKPINNIDQLRLPVKIKNISCKGKFIYWELEGDWHLCNTLGMTGSWGKAKNKHSGAEFFIKEEGFFYFNDPRHFGTLYFCTFENLNLKLASLGCNVLHETIENFYLKVSKYQKTLAEFLMDQSQCAGVGNYIKSEGLYRAKLSPWRKSNSLTSTETTNLLLALRTVIQEALLAGGATIATFQDFNGNAGTFNKQFQVYRKKCDPLGNTVKNETTLDKRTSWWVPELQQ